MVQTYQSPIRVYKYPFELVMAAYEKRFPTCKMIPVFVASDIVTEYKSEDGAVHNVERRCKLSPEVPYILKKIVGVDYIFFIQRNSLDMRARTLNIDAYNESFSNRIIINEHCTYYVHPDNSSWTCFEQNASLDVKNFFGFENMVEKIAMKQYSQNISKGKEIIDYYIQQLKEAGVTYVAPFQGGPAPLPAIEVTQVKDVQSPVEEGAEGAQEGACKQEPTAEDSNMNLDTDYIARCLGNLTPFQESRLVQLKKWVTDAQKGKVPSDSTLLRFLRAREFNLEKSREMLCQSLVWRKKYNVDRILSTYNPPDVVKKYFPGGWIHQDKDGRPLYLLRLGQMDMKGLIKSVGEEGVLKLVLSICEEGLQRTEEATKTSGKPICAWTCLVDMDGLNMRHLWRPGIKALLRVIEVVEANYPETMGRALIIRSPRVFPILWTIVSTFIDENTRQKFLFYGGNDYQTAGGISDYIDDQYIPDFLGGKYQVSIPEGGLVPKSSYMTDEEYEKARSEDNPLCEDTIYQSVSLLKGQAHEIIINNEDKGSVICWDFDVMKQDVTFTVFRSKQPIARQENSLPAPLTPGSVHTLSAEPSSVSCIDKTWKEGTDYWRVEQPLVCHDGESIQGSHVTSHTGYYVLQWRFDEPLNSHLISNHKSKIMYYCEVLRSQDFRGSMSSLQSSHSQHSSSSTYASTSCPSR